MAVLHGFSNVELNIETLSALSSVDSFQKEKKEEEETEQDDKKFENKSESTPVRVENSIHN